MYHDIQVSNGTYLKGEYKEYNMGVSYEKPLNYPRIPILFSSVDSICSNRKKNPLQIPYFRIFTRVKNQPLKQRLKQKRGIIFKNFLNIFSFAKVLSS